MANPPSLSGASKQDERASHKPANEPVDHERLSAPEDGGVDLPRALGRYMLLKRIARGGMGEVLLASTMGIEGAERPVIVKIIRREHKKDPNFYARFLDETRVQAQLSHSGVAQVIDAALDDATGEPYAVVEHVEGKSLGELRQRALSMGHRLTWPDAVALAQLIAEGLAHVHERKDASGRPLAIVHRDLSPQNVMVSFTGEVKIIDFGTARGQNRRCHTVAGVVFAKPGYVAPEVANGDSGDARVDLYALGIMLWELCAGRRFLQGDAQVHLAKVARNELSPPKIAAQLGAPEDLDAAIAKLTAFERDARYLAARAAATDLAKLLAHAPALASGERGVRSRTAHLMTALFPGEPLASRREFARLVAAARTKKTEKAAAPPAPAPRQKAPLPAPAPAPAPAAKAEPPRSDKAPSLDGTSYRMVREIGRGASSVVIEVEHVETKKRAALKVLAGESATDPAAIERFRRGARALSLLEHAHLVRVHDTGTLADGRPFCVMDLYDGETLADFVSRERGADYREALGIASKILSALEVAHANGLVHRDVQPSNVLLVNGGGLRLLDFGLAGGRAIALDSAARGPSRDVVLHGTPEYMAPEQATSGEVDGRADLYSVGCVMFELLTGRLPFEGASAVAVLDQKRKGSPPKPQEIAPGRAIPEAVSAVVMKALARHPSARFQSASEMKKAIDGALGAGRPRSKSRRLLSAIAAVTAVTALALLATSALALRYENVRARMPARVAGLFAPKAPAITADPASAPEPARTTDLAEVPLGEVALEAPPPAVPAAEPDDSNAELAANTDDDPALADPAENPDVVVAADDTDALVANAPANLEENAAASTAPASTAKPAHKTRRHAKPPAKKAAPKSTAPAPKVSAAPPALPPTKATKPASPVKAEGEKKGDAATKGGGAEPAKSLAPAKDDEDAARRKKKKVRLAKAH